MTIQQLTDFFRDLSLKHKDVLEFQVGSWYDAAANTSNKYPLVYWEVPYNITYNQELSRPLDTIIVSLSVFLSSKVDSIKDDNEAISYAKSIGDAIITKARLTAVDFKIQSANAVSVREFTDDNVAGMRYDLTLLIKRDICDAEINLYFNE